MTESVAFDRAAAYYDRTRALPEATMREVVALVGPVLAARGRVLELGVGTGRIALPLAASGVDITGIDLSAPMLAQLRANAGGRAPFPLVRGDATRTPFPRHTFGAAYLVHVLHLIPRWRDVLDEVVRVVRPGGHLLVDHGGHQGIHQDIAGVFQDAAGIERRHPGLVDTALLDAAMAELGAPLRILGTIAIDAMVRPATVLGNLADNRWSYTWTLSDDERERAVAATRAWALERYGDLDAEIPALGTVVWRAYDLPG